jgi:hypothetical protein
LKPHCLSPLRDPTSPPTHPERALAEALHARAALTRAKHVRTPIADLADVDTWIARHRR